MQSLDNRSICPAGSTTVSSNRKTVQLYNHTFQSIAEVMQYLTGSWLEVGKYLGIEEEELTSLCSDYPADTRNHNPIFIQKVLELWVNSTADGHVDLSDLVKACVAENGGNDQNTGSKLAHQYLLWKKDKSSYHLYEPHLATIQFCSTFTESKIEEIKTLRKTLDELQSEYTELNQHISVLEQQGANPQYPEDEVKEPMIIDFDELVDKVKEPMIIDFDELAGEVKEPIIIDFDELVDEVAKLPGAHKNIMQLVGYSTKNRKRSIGYETAHPKETSCNKNMKRIAHYYPQPLSQYVQMRKGLWYWIFSNYNKGTINLAEIAAAGISASGDYNCARCNAFATRYGLKRTYSEEQRRISAGFKSTVIFDYAPRMAKIGFLSQKRPMRDQWDRDVLQKKIDIYRDTNAELSLRRKELQEHIFLHKRGENPGRFMRFLEHRQKATPSDTSPPHKRQKLTSAD